MHQHIKDFFKNIDKASVRLQLTTTAPTACCPCCGVPSSSVHSRYQRHLTDLAWGSRSVRIQLMVRKFSCRNPTCTRRIFTERLPDLVAVYTRNPVGWSRLCRRLALPSVGTRAPGSRPACGCRAVRPPSSGWCGRLRYHPCQPCRSSVSTSGPGGGGIAMAPSSST
jgi:zinc-finger of transposase IS204/IS1001/IS1096/IS1165